MTECRVSDADLALVQVMPLHYSTARACLKQSTSRKKLRYHESPLSIVDFLKHGNHYEVVALKINTKSFMESVSD